MATRKTTTKAKTKTTKVTKKPAARTARASKASTARSSKVSTKVTAVKAVSKQGKKVKTTRRNILTVGNLLAAATVLFFGLAILAAMFMESTTYSLTMAHQTRDALVSETSTVFVTAYRALFDIEIRWLVVALLGFSMILPLLYLTKLKDFYASSLINRRVVAPRWVDLGVSTVLMTEIVLLLAGVTDIVTLKLAGGLVALTCALSWLAEKQNEKTRSAESSAFTLSLFAGVMPVLAIVATLLATVVYGAERNTWFVYALGATLVVGLSLLMTNQFNQHRRYKSWVDYTVVERNYLMISTLTKVAFAAILIIGFFK